jgi:hypothetical protein
MSSEPYQVLRERDARKESLAKRLDESAWALFLIVTGIVWLVPEERLPNGAWLIGTGILLLALNVARYAAGLGVGVFTTILGVLALAGGLNELFGADVPLLALGLLVLGVSILVKPFFGGRP